MGGHRGSFVFSVTIVGLIVGLASGCTGAQGASGPDASPSPSRSASATATASSTASSTATVTLDDAARARIPKAARAHTAKGAEAFARFYLEQVNKAWMVPDPELIRPFALESCKTCANIVDTASWLEDNRLRYDGDAQDVGPSVVLPESTKDSVLVEVSTNQLARHILSDDGETAESINFAHSVSQVELRRTRDGWFVSEIKEGM